MKMASAAQRAPLPGIQNSATSSGIRPILENVRILGMLVIMVRMPRATGLILGPRTANGHRELSLGMEVIVNLLGDGFVDAGGRLEIGETRACHTLGGAEVVEECALALGANARNLVKQGLGDRPRSLGAMGADSEAVRLVAQALQKIEDRIAWLE